MQRWVDWNYLYMILGREPDAREESDASYTMVDVQHFRGISLDPCMFIRFTFWPASCASIPFVDLYTYFRCHIPGRASDFNMSQRHTG
jgi:hypothetical protein